MVRQGWVALKLKEWQAEANAFSPPTKHDLEDTNTNALTNPLPTEGSGDS